MKNITNNPFRIIGLDASCSNKQIIKNTTKYETYAAIDREVEFPFDHSFFGTLNRSSESINKSKNAIHIDDRKIQNAFFWFMVDSAFDEIAIEELKSKNYEKAINIWKKQVKNTLSDESISAYNNLSTAYLLLGTVPKTNTVMLKEGLMLKCKILESNSLEYLSKKICGDDYLIKKEQFSHEVIQIIQNDLKDTLTEQQLIKVISDLPHSTKEAFTNELVSNPMIAIDKCVKETKEVTKENKQAEKYGKDLIKNTHEALKKIKNILGEDDYNYGIYADKIAHQITQTGIFFFNGTRDDYSYLESYRYALQIAVSNEIKNNAQEAIDHCIRQKEAKKCWFCETNEIQSGKELRVQMHKFIPNENIYDFGSRRYTYFKDGGWPVGRCSSCKEQHDSYLGISFLQSLFDGESKIKKASNSSIRNHPQIKKHLNDGYEFGLPQ